MDFFFMTAVVSAMHIRKLKWISLNSIDELSFVVVNQCVLCEVGTEMLNIRSFLYEFQASKDLTLF
jgi:hypothetical protein